MKVLVIGGGGREHALAWKLSESAKVTDLYCAPGNAGTASIAENIPIAVDQLDQLTEFALSKNIDLTVVGPEYPLTLGIVDKFREKGLRIFGPSKSAAEIEGSKAFAKRIMEKAGIATAEYREFDSASQAEQYIRDHGAPLVVKADGLAAGKGVYVCMSVDDAVEAVKALFDESGFPKVIVEDYLPGKEASYIVVTDGHSVVPMASSHDYKRIYDGDKGPNTGGMGTVSPTPRLTSQQEAYVLDHVMRPAIAAMAEEGCPFAGFLYAGLMISDDGDFTVLEFNARMGDPEGQVILRRMQSDLFELLYSLSGETPVALDDVSLNWDDCHAICVVLASAGYPATSSKGDRITGIDRAESNDDCVVFHAGTAVDSSGALVTAGGRVLNVTAVGSDFESAYQRAYEAADKIEFSGCQLRRDIGKA